MLSKTLLTILLKNKIIMDSPLRLLLHCMSYSCDLTFRGREEREENNYFAKFYRKKMK